MTPDDFRKLRAFIAREDARARRRIRFRYGAADNPQSYTGVPVQPPAPPVGPFPEITEPLPDFSDRQPPPPPLPDISEGGVRPPPPPTPPPPPPPITPPAVPNIPTSNLYTSSYATDLLIVNPDSPDISQGGNGFFNVFEKSENDPFVDRFANYIIDTCWQPIRGVWSEITGHLTCTSAPGILRFVGRNYGDVSIRGTYRAAFASTPFYLMARGSYSIADEFSGYLVLYTVAGTTLELLRVDADSDTSLGSFAGVVAGGDEIELTIIGSTLNVFQNGVLRIGPIVDNTYQLPGFVGIGTFAANRMDFRPVTITPL